MVQKCHKWWMRSCMKLKIIQVLCEISQPDCSICNINGERVIEGEAELYVPTPTEAGQAALNAATTNV